MDKINILLIIETKITAHKKETFNNLEKYPPDTREVQLNKVNEGG